MSAILRLLAGGSLSWAPDLDLTPCDIRADLDTPAGDAVWLSQVEQIWTVPDFVPVEWL